MENSGSFATSQGTTPCLKFELWKFAIGIAIYAFTPFLVLTEWLLYKGVHLGNIGCTRKVACKSICETINDDYGVTSFQS